MIVVDSSVVAKTLFPEPESDIADLLVRTCRERSEPMIAPYLLLAEVTNAVRQRQRGGAMTRAEAGLALDGLHDWPITFLPRSQSETRALQLGAFSLAEEFALPGVYDAIFLALAQSLGCEFWTADARLLRQLNGGFPLARRLDEFPVR